MVIWTRRGRIDRLRRPLAERSCHIHRYNYGFPLDCILLRCPSDIVNKFFYCNIRHIGDGPALWISDLLDFYMCRVVTWAQRPLSRHWFFWWTYFCRCRLCLALCGLSLWLCLFCRHVAEFPQISGSVDFQRHCSSAVGARIHCSSIFGTFIRDTACDGSQGARTKKKNK